MKQIKFSTVHYSDRKFSAIQCKSSVCCCFQIELDAVQLCVVLCCALQCGAVHNIVQKSSAGLLLLASAAISPNPIRGLILRMSPHTALTLHYILLQTALLNTVHSTVHWTMPCTLCIVHCAIWSVHSTVHFTLCTVHCTLCNTHWAVFYCTVHSVLINILHSEPVKCLTSFCIGSFPLFHRSHHRCRGNSKCYILSLSS